MHDALLLAAHWDGYRLTLQLAPALAGERIVLLLDGLYFSEATATTATSLDFDFPCAPGGSDTLDFSLRRATRDGASLLDGWRVGYGQAATWPMPAAHAMAPGIGLQPLFGAVIFSPLQQPRAMQVAVTIIVPIYNAVALVQRCIEALLEHTQGAARLLLIDDASSDPAIAPLLQRYHHMSGVTVLSNPENLGYTHSIARGLALAEHGDVVVLNADTEVGPNWLPGLRRAAYARADIGTATAVSDNAGAFSVPELEHDCAPPSHWSSAQLARALWQQAGLLRPALPTGNGFCMYLKRTMLDRVGGPDVDAFPQGYGEENDWCQRAELAGFVHVIAGDVMVRHARSASFGAARRASLGAAGMAVLRQRYPHYESAVGATLFSFERRVLDWRVRHCYRAAATNEPPRPRVLWIGGDDAATAASLHADCELWRLDTPPHALELSRHADREWQRLQRVALAPCVAQVPASWLRYEEILASWLQHYAIELIVVIDDSGHSGNLAALAAALQIPLLGADATGTALPGGDATTRYRDALQRQRSFAAVAGG